MSQALDTLLLLAPMVMMLVTVVLIIVGRNLFGVVVLTGAYSFLMATVLFILDAIDVAMTEAAVGAGISTVLLLGALRLCGWNDSKPMHRPWGKLVLSGVLAALLMVGMVGLPEFSDPASPIHQHVAPRYLIDSQKEIDVPNVVTAVLASYRGYDTLGETTVVFTAGAGVIALLRRRRRDRSKSGQSGDRHAA
jgi:multicomponent Na+:H+ antiporter subunit B